MKCAFCGEIIKYDSGVSYMELITKEMVYGEFCIYPTETAKVLVCSTKCLDLMIHSSEDKEG